MTHPIDVARGRAVIARWRDLAEQRLEHLTELFESGRWRRYHSEISFLENIQEAKHALQTWRELSAYEASPDRLAAISRLGPVKPIPRAALRDRADRLSPQPARIAAEPPPVAAISAARESATSEGALSAGEVPVPTLHLATMRERYPLLRNVL